MNDRVRKILWEESRRKRSGSRASQRELLSRAALVGLGLFAVFAFASNGSRPTAPKPLTDIERQAALDIARTTNISVQDAEALVLAHRPSDADRRRWAAERKQREAEQDALQLAFPD